MRYKITLSYNGAPFCGWQRQPGAPSVQETLENALGTLLGGDIPVTGAGRTDTGVSAVGYVAHFDAPSELDTEWLACKLNAILPVSVAVSSVEAAAEGFHARFDAVKRSYTYFLHRRKDPFMADRSYLCMYPELDFNLMNKAAAMLPGTHDFSCFQKTGSDNKTTVCTVFEAAWHPYLPSPEAEPTETRATLGIVRGGTASAVGSSEARRFREVAASGASGYWYFRISADRFLRNMVRAIVGTLLEVGRGKRSLEDFASLLDGGSRSRAGESVPGHALFLTGIDY